MKKFSLLILLGMFIFGGCSEKDSDIEIKNNGSQNENLLNVNVKQKYLEKFAGILSKAVYERKDVREFLKTESLKQFDKNFNVLYYLISDVKINEKSFRDILISYSSKEAIEEIENNVPLLNILVPEITFFDIYPQDLDTDDSEIPVVVSKDYETALYFKGEKELSLKKGEIPSFHVFVVNENSRVIIPENNLKSRGVKTIMFKSPNYDGSLVINEQPILKSTIVDNSIVGKKAIDAFSYFNKDDGSINQKAFQRDYIYYGITPQNQTGNLNRSVSEYISFIQVDANSYFNIANEPGTKDYYGDPKISNHTVTQEKRGLSEEELLDRMWTKGSYNFKFEILTSTQEQSQVVYVPLKPNELWDFNISHSYRHSTWFRHSKNTYTIDANKFTSKPVVLKEKISLGKWDISEEALFRYIKISEEDSGAEVTETETYEMSKALKTNFSGNAKIGIGLKGKEGEAGASASVESTTTEKITKSYTIKRKIDSDQLGKIRIYFYDPLVHKVENGVCELHTYYSGHVKVGISVE